MTKFYAIRKGRKPGIVETWEECKDRVHGVASEFKSFNTREEAAQYIREGVLGRLLGSAKEEPFQATRVEDPVGPPVVESAAAEAPAGPEAKSRAAPSILPNEEMGKRIPSTGLGRAGSRTADQQIMALHEAHELIKTFAPIDVVCFTDGACSGNPGPCGAGAWLKFPALGDEEETVIERSAALGLGTNNVGEVYAVGLAMDLIMEAKAAGTKVHEHAKIHILTDSKYTKGMLALGYKANANLALIEDVKDKLGTVCDHHPVFIHWVAGHSSIKGNEVADQLAGKGRAHSEAGIHIVPVVPPKRAKMQAQSE